MLLILEKTAHILTLLNILPCLLAAATGAPQLLVGAGVCGQVSHQSVSKPLQGESRSTVQSKAAPALADPQAEVSPFSYNYAVNDDYSGSAFTASESNDGLGARSGSYSVALPDGRTQTVTYSTDDVNGYVAEVSYEGAPTSPQTKLLLLSLLSLLQGLPLEKAQHRLLHI